MEKNNLLSNTINRLSESATLAMTRKSRELAAKGIDVINLSIGEPDFNTPDKIKQAAIEAINNNFSFYTPVPGIPELRKAISEKFKRENNVTFTPEEIVVSTGAKQSLANVIMCLINEGEEVLIPTPYWVTYIEQVKLANGIPIEIKTSVESDFKVTPQQIESAITNKTKAILFSSPCNPSGSVYSYNELKAIAELLVKYPNIFVISDEIYEYINFTGTKHTSIAEFECIKDRVIIINGVSKGYAMTGWRLGDIGAPKWIADACTKLQGQMTSATCSIAQKAAVVAVSSGIDETVINMQNAFKQRRDLVLKLVKDIPNFKTTVPDGAFYIFADLSAYFGKKYAENTVNNAEELALYLLNEAHVAAVDGNAFGNKDCMRFSYATSEEKLEKAFERIKIALAKLS